jgi:hypothetical protein
MKKNTIILLAALIGILAACDKKQPDATAIIDKAIRAHGSNLFTQSKTTFIFRETAYSVTRATGSIAFTRRFISDNDTIQDVKTYTGITRYRNGVVETASDSLKKKYDAALNSVVYFTQLPYSLDGPAVIKKHLGMDTIKGEKYHEIEVTFNPDGGGEDHEDVFVYWVNARSYLIDYMAYSFCEVDCGYRFRESVNRSNHKGIIMQDYKNYKSTLQDPKLQLMDDLFEEGRLELLSEIINKDVVVTLKTKK